MKGCTAGEFKELQSQIQQSSLDDYKEWVQQQSETLAEANGRGDTKKIFEVVNTLKGKAEKPPANLTTDGQGSMLRNAEDVADRWYNFLSKKFVATELETQRAAMPALPNTR